MVPSKLTKTRLKATPAIPKARPATPKAPPVPVVTEAIKYRDRYKAMGDLTRMTRLDLAELQTWSDAEDMRINVYYALRETGSPMPEGEGRFYLPLYHVATFVAQVFLKNNSEAQATLEHVANSWLLLAAEDGIDVEGFDDKTRAFFGVYAKVSKDILCAVYDGKLRLYDYIGTPVDVTYHRMAYEARMADSLPGELPSQRKERLRQRAAELKQSGLRAFLKQIAEEEGISSSRVKQLLARELETDD